MDCVSRCRTYALAVVFALGLAPSLSSGAEASPAAPPSFTVPDLVALARTSNPALSRTRARITGAEAAVVTARAVPNPEVAWWSGRQSISSGHSRTGAIEFTQAIDRPAVRGARIETAQTAVEIARHDAAEFERDLIAELKLKALEVQRLQAAARLAEQALAIAEQIRERVQVRVGTGEAPRFELIRADTERLNAQRAYRAAVLRIDMARTELRRLTGPTLPASFTIAGHIDDPVQTPPPLPALRRMMLENHPGLRAARAAHVAAQARLKLEQTLRQPALALKLSRDQMPDVVDNRIGLAVTLPIFDRRQGPIAEARSELERSQLTFDERALTLEQELQGAWQRYELAQAQVSGFESGLLQEAEAALRVAEAAYRYGERGILDYLDAQRTVRTVRDELNLARYELRAALIDLERLGAVSE